MILSVDDIDAVFDLHADFKSNTGGIVTYMRRFPISQPIKLLTLEAVPRVNWLVLMTYLL